MCSKAARWPEGSIPEDREPAKGVAASPTAEDEAAPNLMLLGQAEQRIAEIERAIDDLADMSGPAGLESTKPMVVRVAELWGLLAELDPEIARRLAGYQALSAAPTQPELADGTLNSVTGTGTPPRERLTGYFGSAGSNHGP